MANQLSEVLHLKYERAHLAYLLIMQNIRDAEAGLYGQRTITGALRKDDTPALFGGYEDTDGLRGVSVTAHYLVECLFQEYQRQEAALTQVLQGTFGQAKYQWVDRTAVLLSELWTQHLMSTCSGMPGGPLKLSWQRLLQGNLKNLCASCLKYNEDIIVKLDLFHCMRRFTRECVSEHHPLYSSFCHFLFAAFSVVDQSGLEKLKNAYRFCGIEPANPTKQHIREHCRTKVPHPRELVQTMEEVLQHFHLAKDSNNIFALNVKDSSCCTREPETTPQTVLFHWFSTPSPVTVKEQRSEEFLLDAELLSTPSTAYSCFSPCSSHWTH
ncbi:hypothetical protein PHYPO_G00092450 [Pangasianodon hypophthalmus]|uniref:Uncharacterized protein n=1 Tax=Pangasianodon hypophthalmus TaxID=310915 RepID=A0A5N5LAH1_PANHP|nr:hypothetical protein PHYPO_G00092450 [Pangasianodon hypophthalmus]